MGKPLLPVTSDFVFKMIFGDQRNADILAAFLKSVLDIPDEEYDHLTVVDPYVKKESADDKYGILDVKVHTVSGSVVHVEIQVKVIPELTSRTVYSQSKLITEQLSSRQKFAEIKRVASILITDENFIPGEGYHHQFRYRTAEGMEFTNLVEINTLELRKLPTDDDSTELWYWMQFIRSDNEEVLEMLAQRSPAMRKAVGVLKELSADERSRMLFESREMARMDFESMNDKARRDGSNERAVTIARNALKKSMPISDIADITGLTREEIEALKRAE
jgi:predicted transposase/invertase (TIGR01784 family)